jgi:hypothetical protein
MLSNAVGDVVLNRIAFLIELVIMFIDNRLIMG